MLGKLCVRAVLLSAFILGSLVGPPEGASAASFTYRLHNHPVPGSGLRLDGLGSLDTHDVFSFDFDDPQSSVTLVYDDGSTPGLGDDTVRIFGTVFGGLRVGSGFDPQVSGLWSLDFFYRAQITSTGGDGSGIVVSADDPTNNGTITPLFSAPNLPQGVPIPLVDEAGSHPFSFKFNNTEDHRLEGTGLSGPDTFVGWGWLNHSDVAHIYHSDWLFTGEVPEPGWLVLLGLAGLAPRLRGLRA